MKKNNKVVGISFLDKIFPNWELEDEEIQAEKERVVAAAAAANAEDIDNSEDEEPASTTAGTAGNGGGRTVNIGSINIGGDLHVHMDAANTSGRRDSWSRRSSDDDDVIDVDYVDTTTPKKPAPTPPKRLTQSSQSLSKKQELTKDIRMGDFDALSELDELIESGNTEKLIELFNGNKPLCFWIRRTTQQHRWNKLPAIVQNLVNQQL